MTALSQAIRHKRWRQARLLIEAGSDINQRCQADKRTALMEVCFLDEEGKALGLAKMLLENGADLGFQDAKGLTALSYACILRRSQLVHLFLRFVDYNLNAVDRDANTPLFHAITVGDLSVVKMLIKKLRYYDLTVDTQNHKGETPLIHALKIGNIEAAELLIREGKASLQICDLEEFKTAAQWKKEVQQKDVQIISAFYSIENEQNEQTNSARNLQKTTSAKPLKFCSFPEMSEAQTFNTGRPLSAPGIIQVSDFFSPCTPIQEELLQLYKIYNQQWTSSYRKGYKFTPRAIRRVSPLEETVEIEEISEDILSEHGKSKMNFEHVSEVSTTIRGLQKAIKNTRKNSLSPANSDDSAKLARRKSNKLLRRVESSQKLAI
ncbi:ankyrin repeat domain-containing protein 36C-like [Montipora capricornis]|uniref:ankyrin repeat domain-containing protein 36C-like n=1 Tax=Montipora capricornis TaxID=246305 RepID=UPI0035F19C88